MADVIINGVFMGANIKTKTFEGKSSTKLNVDIYQPESEANEKSITLTTDDVELYQTIIKEYATGSFFTCEARVTAYKNKTYFKLVKLILPNLNSK